MRPMLILGYAIVVTGCVTQSAYDTLKADRDALQATVAQRDKALAEKDQALDAAKGREKTLADQGKSLEQQLDAEKGRVADLNRRIDKLAADIAAATKDRSRLQSSVEEMTRALAELQKRKAEAEARVAEFKNLVSRFSSLIDAGKLKVKIVDGRMVVVLATDILFPSGSASLNKDGKAAVTEVAQVLATIPKRAFQVEGHTDNVPIATAQYPSNWELAAARAITVLKTMVDGGLDPTRVSAASFADTRPVAANDSNERRSANRRIEIIIVPDLSALPGFEELKKLETAS